MIKYIDAEKLKAELKGFRNKARERIDDEDSYFLGLAQGYDNAIDIITSLQQEQPEAQNGKFVFPKYLYARTKDNKTIDMSYAPQDMTAVEYVRNDFVQQETPEVDLEKEIIRFLSNSAKMNKGEWRGKYAISEIGFRAVAHHFYELGLNARKED